MSVRENLILDHFYIGLPPQEFEKLAPLTTLLTNCSRKKVQSGDESWEGIYTLSQACSYFEIVNDANVHGLGLAFSLLENQNAQTSNIVEEIPNLRWKQ